MVMPPSSSEYPSAGGGAYSRQQQQSGPSPGMLASSPMQQQQASLASRNPLSPQPWPPQRPPSHMSGGPPTPQQLAAQQQQQMNGNMMSGGSMQEMAASAHHLAASMDADMARPRSQDAQSAQQTVPEEGDSRRPDQSDFSLDKFVDSKEPDKSDDQDKVNKAASESFSAPDFGPYQVKYNISEFILKQVGRFYINCKKNICWLSISLIFIFSICQCCAEALCACYFARRAELKKNFDSNPKKLHLNLINVKYCASTKHNF